MMIRPIIRTKTTLVTGFLGAGKTTLINTLTAKKSDFAQTEVWGLLINEFGQIGIDGTLIKQDKNITIKEISGGCICCSGQLTFNITLARLLKDRPDRVIIEPTGLVETDELLGELGAPHWQNSLNLTTVICVLNAHQWQNERYKTHVGYQMHVRCADMVVVSMLDNKDHLSDIQAWVYGLNPDAVVVGFEDFLKTSDDWQLVFGVPHRSSNHQRIVSLNATPLTSVVTQRADDLELCEDRTPPYRYHQTLGEWSVGGWILPSTWVFDEYILQKWLLSLPNYERIKGVIHSQNGFISINITPQNISVTPTDDKKDNRLELILADDVGDDIWGEWDKVLISFAQF